MALPAVGQARGGLRAIWLCALFSWLPIVPTGVFAAQTRAAGVSLNGIVRDSTGLVLPGATVELRPDEPAHTRSTVTAADGTFVFSDVRIGPYRLRVSFPEFESFDQGLTFTASPSRPLVVVLA